MNAKTILLPLFLKLVRLSALTAAGWFVRKGWIGAQDGDSLVTVAVDSAPGLLLLLPAFASEVWLWLSKFDFIVKLETALHLPATGKPSTAAIQVAQEAKIVADISEKMATSIPPYAVPKIVIPALLLLLLPVCLTGCTAFRRDISDVSAYGGYSDAAGDAYKAGVKFGIRPPLNDTSK